MSECFYSVKGLRQILRFVVFDKWIFLVIFGILCIYLYQGCEGLSLFEHFNYGNVFVPVVVQKNRCFGVGHGVPHKLDPCSCGRERDFFCVINQIV